ncbi:MAG: SprB repeat-containing protein, partial [Specibacter sp.]
GNYIVNVKDANDCIVPIPVFLDIDPTPVVAASINPINQCAATEGNFVIDVTLPTAGIAPYSYSVDGGVYQSQTAPFTISNLSSGTHTVQVKDFNGCGNLVSVTILAPLGLTPTVTALPTCATNDGKITVSGSGGTGVYTYSIVPNPASITLAGNVFSGVPVGTYDVTITDGTPCVKMVTVVLSAPTLVTFNTSKTDVSCNGGNNGTITVELLAGNDNPTYTYTLTATSGPVLVVGPQGDNIFTGLTARSYDITVNSGRGCSLTKNVAIIQPSTLTVDASSSATAFGCAADNTVNTSTVTINATVGSGTTPYTYSIDGTNYFTTNTFSVIDNGTSYSLPVYIKDANGCPATGSVAITALPKLTAATVAINSPIDCNNTGSIAITVAGGSGNFSYQLLPSGIPQSGLPTSNIFSITAPGTYNFQVNDLTTGCYIATLPYTVAPFNTIDVVATATKAVTCFGDTDGAIEINVSGYSGAYTYQVFDSSNNPVGGIVAANTATNPQPIVGLLAGNYTVAIAETASPFCTKVTNVVTVGSPNAGVSLTITTVNDNCNVNAGQIVAGAQGGTAPYLYQILPVASPAPLVTDPGWSATTTLNAESGNYVVYVKDVNDCPQSQPVTIGLDPTPVVAAVLNNQCTPTEGNFVIDVTLPTAGMPPYSYSIDGGAYQSQTAPFTISNLSSGTHTVQVKDFNGCGNLVSVTIQAPLGLTPTITTLPSCAVLPDGVITATATGGSTNYSYTLLDGASVVITGPQASGVFSGLAAGSYQVKGTDTTTGCEKTVAVVLSAPTPVTFSTTKTDVSCNGGNNGTITVVLPASNDNPTYTYTLTATSGTALVVGPQGDNVFTGLTARSYDITVNSGRGCGLTQTVTIGQPSALTVDASSFATAFGCAADNTVNTSTVTINETAGTGTAPYTYSIDGTNYFPTNTFSIIDNGTAYNLTVYIKDANGCPATGSVAVTPLPKLTAATVAINSPIDCNNTGSIAITVAGGSGNFSYQLLPCGIPQSALPTTNILNITAPGTYNFHVKDLTTGCTIATLPYT